MAMTSLFGPTPAQIEDARRLQVEEQIRSEGAELGPFRGLYQAGRRLGAAGGQSLISGLFPEAADPALREAQAVENIRQKYMGQNMTDPRVLQQMAIELGPIAPMASLRLAQTARQLTPEREKDAVVKTSEAAARAAGELGFGVRPNLADYTEQELTAINNLLQTRGERVQAAGVPQSGQVKITDLSGAQGIVDRFTKEPAQRLTTVKQLGVSLREVKAGTGAALPQLERDLVKLVGDSQIGMGEVQRALGSVGIVGDAISGINKLFTGVPSAQKIADVEKFVKALEDEHAKSYNSGRVRAEKVLKEAKLSPETVTTLIPPAYKTGREKKEEREQKAGKAEPTKKPAATFQEGKVYRDANGNRARYVNGKWEPVQ